MGKNYRRLFLFTVLLLYLVTLFIGCSNEPVTATTADYWPTDGWKTSTPEAQGMDSEELNHMFQYIADKKLDIHSVLIVRNGYLVTEGYYYPHKKEYRHILNSTTKSITSALVGLAIEDGYIESVDQKVVDIFHDWKIENLDERKEAVKIKNLLTMTAGLNWNESGAYGASNDSNTQMWRSKNQVQYVLDRPMREEPGKRFYYNTGASHVLSAIVQRTSGKSSLEYAREKIFTPLGISDIAWGTDNQGIYTGGSRIFMKPEDLAKYGYLYLNKGKWEDKQIIPGSWIEESTQKHFDTPTGLAGRYGYGYQWWQNKFGGYSGRGFSGQYLFVLPEHNLVIVFTSGLKPSDFFEPEELVDQFILPAIKDSKSVSENPVSLERFHKTLEDINKAPSPKPVPMPPEIAAEVSGKTFVMDNKETFSFDFNDENECTMHWFTDGMMYDVKVGLDGLYRENTMEAFYWKGMTSKAGFRGSWTDSNTFAVDLLPLEDSNVYTMLFKFDGNTLHAKMILMWNGAALTDSKGTTKE